MMFGETKKEFFFKNIKGRGYADTGKGVITEFVFQLFVSRNLSLALN